MSYLIVSVIKIIKEQQIEDGLFIKYHQELTLTFQKRIFLFIQTFSSDLKSGRTNEPKLLEYLNHIM